MCRSTLLSLSSFALSWLLVPRLQSVVHAQECVSPENVAEDEGLSQFTAAINSLESRGNNNTGVLNGLTRTNEVGGDLQATTCMPTDEAFLSIGQTNVASLPVDELDRLVATHIAAGKADLNFLKQAVAAADPEEGVLVPSKSNGDFLVFRPLNVNSLPGRKLSQAEVNDLEISVEVFGGLVNAARFVKPDNEACGGLVHVVDSVLLPAPCGSLLDALFKLPEAQQFLTVLQRVVEPSVLTQLTDPNRKLTAFVPNNAAVSALAVTLASSESDAVSNLVLSHILPDRYFLRDLPQGADLVTFGSGAPLVVVETEVVDRTATVTLARMKDAVVKVNDTQLVDSCSENALVYVIDGVFMDEATSVCKSTQTVMQEAGLTTFTDAIDSLGLGAGAGASAIYNPLTSSGALPADAQVTLCAPTNGAVQSAESRGLVDLQDAESFAKLLDTHAAAGAVSSNALRSLIDASTDPLLNFVAAGVTGDFFQFRYLNDLPEDLQRRRRRKLAQAANPNLLEIIPDDKGPVTVSVYNGLNDMPAILTVPDNAACGGLMHVVDEVLAPAPCGNLLDGLRRQPFISKFTALLEAELDAGTLSELVNGSSPHTVIAPHNDAVDAVSGTIATNPAQLTNFVKSHIISSAFSKDTSFNGEELDTLSGLGVQVILFDDMVQFLLKGSGSIGTVTELNVTACSGSASLHIIDTFLLTEEAKACKSVQGTLGGGDRDQFNTLVNTVSTAGPTTSVINDLLSDGTPADLVTTCVPPNNQLQEVLAKMNQSNFAALERLILTHIAAGVAPSQDILGLVNAAPADTGAQVPSLSGDTLVFKKRQGTRRLAQAATNALELTVEVFGGAEPPAVITQPDNKACAGLVHFVSQVLRPAPCSHVLNAVRKDPGLSLFAGLVDQLDDDSLLLLTDPAAELTIFVPHNSAFDRLQNSSALSNPAQVRRILRGHIVPSTSLRSVQMLNGDTLTTLLGPSEPLTVLRQGDALSIAPPQGWTSSLATSAERVSISTRTLDAQACARNAAMHVVHAVMIPMDTPIAPAPPAPPAPVRSATPPGGVVIGGSPAVSCALLDWGLVVGCMLMASIALRTV